MSQFKRGRRAAVHTLQCGVREAMSKSESDALRERVTELEARLAAAEARIAALEVRAPAILPPIFVPALPYQPPALPAPVIVGNGCRTLDTISIRCAS